jgi:CRP-like cAMP-binding protein
MAAKRPPRFNPKTFLEKVGTGKTTLTPAKNYTIFSQGDAADAVFFIQSGNVKLSIVSQQGKEAVLALLEPGAFFGEACLAGQVIRMATAIAQEESVLVRIEKTAMIRVLHKDLRAVYVLFAVAQHAHRRGFGGSALQFQREATRARVAPAGAFWEGR